MASRLIEIFSYNELLERIKERLPTLFYLAEIESSRAGKVGMEVGSLRESILIALLVYVFGEENVIKEWDVAKNSQDDFTARARAHCTAFWAQYCEFCVHVYQRAFEFCSRKW